MKKILVPIDFSASSENASRLAGRIAKKSDSEVHLLHLVELPSGIIDMASGSNFSIPESMLYLRKVKEQIDNFKSEFFNKKTPITHSIRFQNPHQGIQEYAQKIDADLIVMGSKGHSPLEEILIGSNTEKVVRTSKTPVLVVKKDDDNFRPKNIVFASSFKNGKDEAFKKMLDFSNKFNSKVHLLKVNTPQKFESSQDSKKKMQDYIDKHNLEKHTINVVSDTSVEKGILQFADDINADVIALGTHGRSGLSHIFNGSITKHLSKNALRPMLTFRV